MLGVDVRIRKKKTKQFVVFERLSPTQETVALFKHHYMPRFDSGTRRPVLLCAYGAYIQGQPV